MSKSTIDVEVESSHTVRFGRGFRNRKSLFGLIGIEKNFMKNNKAMSNERWAKWVMGDGHE